MSATAAICPSWLVIDSYANASDRYKSEHPREVVIMSTRAGEMEIATVSDERQAGLLAAAPDLRDSLADLVGLLDLVAGRLDLPADLPSVIRSNHRYQTAIALLKRIEGTK